MKLLPLLLVAATAPAAAAAPPDAAFQEYGANISLRPAQQLAETACDVEIELRGAVAAVEVRRRIANAGPDALAAVLTFDLPPGAQLVGASLGTDVAVAAPASASARVASDPSVLGVDPLLVQLARDGADVHYRAIVQPIAPDRDALVTTRYLALAEIRGGALHVPLLGHPAEPKLTVCRGTVRATPGPGARVVGISAGPRAAVRGATATFLLDAAPLSIDVALDTGPAPLVWTQTQDLGEGWGATVATVIAPRAKVGAGRRVVLAIDGSRSMELVGRHRVAQVVRAIGGALPRDSLVEAVIFDRTAARVLGELRPATPETFAAIEAAIGAHAAGNGSDLAAAFAVAHQVLAAPGGGEALVIAITDGALADPDGAALAAALDSSPNAVDVHAIVLDPATARSPNADALRAPIARYGGALVEVAADDLDRALAAVDGWLRPAILELRLGALAIPPEAVAGGGFSHAFVHRGAAPRLTLTGHAGAAAFSVPARAAPIAQLALAAASAADLTGVPPTAPDPSDAVMARAAALFSRLRSRNAAVDDGRALAVLSATGRIAASRRAMVRGGGSYERSIALRDPDLPASTPPTPAALTAGPSAIAQITVERMFRDQLSPRAYACYQRALGVAPTLGGTAFFELRMGRGEVAHASVTGVGDAAFEACLLDAAYALQPPPPDFTINTDDQTVARYPLTFNLRDDHPLIVPGDADSASPLDIDSIEGGLPARRGPVHVETSTPLGRTRPTR